MPSVQGCSEGYMRVYVVYLLEFFKEDCIPALSQESYCKCILVYTPVLSVYALFFYDYATVFCLLNKTTAYNLAMTFRDSSIYPLFFTISTL